MRRLGLVLGLVLAMQGAPAHAEDLNYMVFFDRGQDTVTPQAMEILRAAAESYRERGDVQVALSGHTARLGSDAANVGLSQRRAANVRAFLAALGVPDGVMTTEAFGESRPLIETADGVAEPQNDRVEIHLGPGSGW